MSVWLALLAFSCSWLFGEHVYTSPNFSVYGFLLAAGVVLLTIAGGGASKLGRAPVAVSRLLVPLLAAAILLPFPYNVGPALAAAGSVLGRGRSGALRALAGGLWISGLLLTVQAAIPPLYFFASANHKEIPGIAPAVGAILDFFGLPAAWDRTTVTVQTMRQLYEIPATWEHLALYPLLLFFVGGVTLLRLCPRAAISVPRLALVLVFYGYLRFAFVILALVFSMLFVEYEKEVSHAYFFWTPWIIAASLLGLPPVLQLVRGAGTTAEPTADSAPASPRAAVFACAGLFLLVVAVGFQDPGTRKPGRLLIDEGHSEWERTTRKYDTTWYGQESGYNYAAIADFLTYYYRVERTFAELTPELLGDYDVLMLKIPTAPFSAAERQAIVAFVRGGGGLLLLGEHTNVFGSGGYLNAVAREFGLRFRFDAIFDIEKTFVQIYRVPRRMPHPIVQRMPPFLFATSCSIAPTSATAEPVILSTGLKSLDIDYASRNFYPQVADATEMRIGPFHQMVAVKAGGGRVAAFSDSTCFSNFSAFIPGKPELLLGSLDWLNRRNRFTNVTAACAMLAVLALSACVLRSRRVQPSLPHLIAWGAATVAVALIAVTAFNRVAYPLPRPEREPVRVVFERQHSDYDLPIEGFTEHFDRSFAIFYQWVLRVGYFPFVAATLDEALDRKALTVIINPVRPFSPRAQERVRRHLEDGGKLLLLDAASNHRSTANDLLAAFGMHLRRGQPLASGRARNAAGVDLCTVEGAVAIEGGEPLLTLDGRPILSRRTVENGTLIVMSGAGRFADSNMGMNESTTPDSDLLEAYALEFALLRGAMQGNLAEELSSNALARAPE